MFRVGELTFLMTPELLTLTRSYQRQLEQVAVRTSSAVARSFLAMEPLTDDAAQAWLRTIRPLVDAGRLGGAGLTDAYLGQYGAIQDSPLVLPEQVYDLEDYSRVGTSVDDVYRRSVIEMRTAISNGASFADALLKGSKG